MVALLRTGTAFVLFAEYLSKKCTQRTELGKALTPPEESHALLAIARDHHMPAICKPHRTAASLAGTE